MQFDNKDIKEFRSLVEKGSTPAQAKQIILNSKNSKIGEGVTDAFVDISSNIYKGFENFSADVINTPLKLFGSDYRVKPISEALIDTGEEYKGGILSRSIDTIGTRGERLGEAITLSGEGEQTGIEGGFQGAAEVVGGVLDIGGDAFISTLSTLTPDKQKKQLKEQIQNIAETNGGQAALQAIGELSESYNRFAEENPRKARNLGAFGTILEGAAEVATGYVGYKGVKTGVKEGKRLGAEGVGKVQGQLQDLIKNQQKSQVTGDIRKVSNTLEETQAKVKPLNPDKLRETEEIAGNILQPYKGMTVTLTDGNRGLQRVTQETDILSNKNATFNDLIISTNQLLGKYGRMLDNELGQIPGTYKDDSINTVLEQLNDVYAGTGSKENREILNRIIDLQSKANNQGLTAKEINDLKILHTKANTLFNEKGQATGGFASDDLRALRKELKLLVENIAEENGISNIKEINQTYGELSATKNLLENQLKNLKAYKGRQLPETASAKIGNIISKIPILSDGVRGWMGGIGLSLRSDKINPIEVQKRLPKLLQELDKAGMARGEIDKIEEEFLEALKGLPAEGQSSFKEGAIVTPQTAERSIIEESKKELVNAKIRLSETNEPAELYDIAKSNIDNIDDPKTLLELKDEISSLGLAKGDKLKKEIDDKISAIKEINQLEATGQQLRGEYGDDLIDNFKKIYRNELNLKTTKGADKYSKIEFNETAGFKKFSTSAEEYITSNPWVGDKTVQDIYDEIKDKILMEDISTLNKIKELGK